MSRRRSSAPTVLRLLHRLTGSARSRRRNSGRIGRSMSVSGPKSRLRGRESPSLLQRHRASIGLAAFFLVLGAVNLYVLYYRHDTSVPALMELASAGRRASLATHTRLIGPPGTPPVPARPTRRTHTTPPLPDYPRVVEVALKEGDTVSAVLRNQLPAAALSSQLSDELQTTLRSLLDPGGLGAGQTFSLYFDLEDRLAALDYRLTERSAFHLERVATGGTERFVSSRQEQPISRQLTSLNISIDQSGDFVGAVIRAGEHSALAVRIGEIFACEFGAFFETQPGDRFRVVVERVLLGGNFYRYGRLLAVEYQPATVTDSTHLSKPARPLRAFLGPSGRNALSAAGAAPGSALHYFHESGDSLARTLCRMPLLYGRGTVGTAAAATLRPVMHSERGRLGIEYPALPGTPVVAAGPGKILQIVRGHAAHGLTGNQVIISHPGGIETTYQNLSRFARGLSEGQPVRLRQIIGYLGQPSAAPPKGRSVATAPRPRTQLLFGLRTSGKSMDLSKWRAAREPSLSSSQRAVFADQVAELIERLTSADTAPGALAGRLGNSANP